MKRPPARRVAVPRELVTPATINVPSYAHQAPMAAAPPPEPLVPLVGNPNVESVVIDRIASLAGGLQTFSVYKTRQMWKAIDVYLDLSLGGSTATWGSGCWSALVFATHQGGRSLVGSGRKGGNPVATPVIAAPSGPVLIASVRGAVAQQYEVDITGFGSSSATDQPFRVIIVARDIDGPPLPGTSAYELNNAGHATIPLTRATNVRIIHATAVNSDAVAKRVMLVENAGLPSQIIHFQGGLEPVIGATYTFDSEALRTFVWPTAPTLRVVTWPGNVADNNVATHIRYQ